MREHSHNNSFKWQFNPNDLFKAQSLINISNRESRSSIDMKVWYWFISWLKGNSIAHSVICDSLANSFIRHNMPLILPTITLYIESNTDLNLLCMKCYSSWRRLYRMESVVSLWEPLRGIHSQQDQSLYQPYPNLWREAMFWWHVSNQAGMHWAMSK